MTRSAVPVAVWAMPCCNASSAFVVEDEYHCITVLVSYPLKHFPYTVGQLVPAVQVVGAVVSGRCVTYESYNFAQTLRCYICSSRIDSLTVPPAVLIPTWDSHVHLP